MTFDEWWSEQNPGLGVAYKFAAWNAWLAATKAEREACAELAAHEIRDSGSYGDEALASFVEEIILARSNGQVQRDAACGGSAGTDGSASPSCED